MTNRERVLAALEGRPVDRCPVTSLYHQLYYQDHFSELTGLPAWRLRAWLAASPEEHLTLYARMQEQTPFELLQPMGDAPPRDWRERQEFVERDGHAYRHDRGTDEWEQLDLPSRSGHATDYHANEQQTVFTRADLEAGVPVSPAAERLAQGRGDYLAALVDRFGRDEFILSGGVIGTLYQCHQYVGLTNLYALLKEDPALIEALSARLLRQNLETIRFLCAVGGDAVYLDDATATSDMISAAMYERFCLPYLREMVAEIHRFGHQAVLIYFGGIADRLELIAATGADGLAYEASMKGYVNDTAEIARRIGDRMTLFSNIDPVAVLQNGSEADLRREIERQVEAGRAARGFLLTPSSPITPSTPLRRVQRFLELAQEIGSP